MTIDDGRYAKIISCSCGAEECGYIGRTGKIVEEHKDGSVNLEIDGFWTHFHTKEEYVIVDPAQPEAEKPKDEGRCKLCNELPGHVIHYLVDVRHYHKFQPKEDAAQASPNRELVELIEAVDEYISSGYHTPPLSMYKRIRDRLAAYRGSQSEGK